ncbi:DALR anticodon-binding domain-containing protein [Actinokineospora bangkokensis]|uniref:Arginine--tRNA ligase n=1 Tax=Actinokineospora bangkokensis TaxID=1193682 RepID=A0A1Q9LGS8_9PSEU|nr:DALR anticodon-binding domain-containing protein [Actinokineospora bangkokensis]OLR91252.1 hypothetical protein BJP25_26645 [Actinokineospora bangkokensis]
MTRAELADLVRRAALGVLGDPAHPPAPLLDDVPLRAPLEAGVDYSTSLALCLAGPAGVPAPRLAARLAQAVTGPDVTAAVAGPGFVNLTLSDRARSRVVDAAFDLPPLPAVDSGDTRPELVAAALARLGTDADGVVVGPATSTGGVERDSLRFALLATPAADPVVVDPAVWGPRLPANPAFAARHAHARAAGALRAARDLRLTAATPGSAAVPPPDTLGLVRALADHRPALGLAARLREPHRVARAAVELAGATCALVDGGLILPRGDADPDPTAPVRLLLCAAARHALAHALGVLGVDAPDRL